ATRRHGCRSPLRSSIACSTCLPTRSSSASPSDVRSVQTPILDGSGNALGTLRISTLPSRADYLDHEDGRIALEEDGVYLFRIDGADRVVLSPAAELFSFDDDSQTRGRLQPRRHVGRIRLAVRASHSAGAVTLTVRPHKLDAETEYRQMLDDIAEVAT